MILKKLAETSKIKHTPKSNAFLELSYSNQFYQLLHSHVHFVRQKDTTLIIVSLDDKGAK